MTSPGRTWTGARHGDAMLLERAAPTLSSPLSVTIFRTAPWLQAPLNPSEMFTLQYAQIPPERSLGKQVHRTPKTKSMQWEGGRGQEEQGEWLGNGVRKAIQDGENCSRHSNVSQREAETRTLNGPLGLTIEHGQCVSCKELWDESLGFGNAALDELGVNPYEASVYPTISQHTWQSRSSVGD